MNSKTLTLICFLMFSLCTPLIATAAPDSAQKLYLLATKAEREGDPSKASTLYEEIISRYPDSPLAIKASDKLLEKKQAEELAARKAAEAQEKASREERQRLTEERIQRQMAECQSAKKTCMQNCRKFSVYQDELDRCGQSCNRHDCSASTNGRLACMQVENANSPECRKFY